MNDTPQIVVEQTVEYRKSEDYFGQFIEDCVVNDPSSQVTVAKLYECYTTWAHKNGYSRLMPQTTFGKRMIERGYKQGRTNSGRFWIGIKMVDPDTSDFPNAPGLAPLSSVHPQLFDGKR